MSADQRVLVGTPATLTFQPLDSDGGAAAPAGTVTIGITAADGTVVVAAGTATTAAPTGNTRTFALTAAQTAALGWLTATWTDSGAGAHTTTVEIVGGYYFGLAEANSVPQLPTANYSTAQLVAARASVEDDWEEIAQVAFVPRYHRERVNGMGANQVMLTWPRVRTVRSVRLYATDGTFTSWTSTQLASLRWDRDSRVITSAGPNFFTAGVENVIVEYEHGHDSLPSPLKVWALRYLRSRLQLTGTTIGIPDRADRSFATDNGAWMTLARPGLDKTGMPDLDAELARYSLRVPGIA